MRTVSRKADVYQIDSHDALIESAVILRLAVFIYVRCKEAAAAHAGVAVPLAVPVDLVLKHDLFGNIVGNHALCSALCGKLGKVPVR